MYSTTNETAKAVCNKIGFIFPIRFVAAMQRSGKIYVKGTCGKLHEFSQLKKACKENGYIYTGKICN